MQSDKQNEDLSYPIYLKIRYKGKSVTLSTGKSISKERWNATNKLRKPLKIDKEKNCKLAFGRVVEQIDKAYYQLGKTKENITVLDIKNKFTGKTDEKKTNDILYLFEIHNMYFEKKVNNGERSKASLQKYKRAKNLLGCI